MNLAAAQYKRLISLQFQTGAEEVWMLQELLGFSLCWNADGVGFNKGYCKWMENQGKH